jgi:hypothetical protein
VSSDWRGLKLYYEDNLEDFLLNFASDLNKWI